MNPRVSYLDAKPSTAERYSRGANQRFYYYQIHDEQFEIKRMYGVSPDAWDTWTEIRRYMNRSPIRGYLLDQDCNPISYDKLAKLIGKRPTSVWKHFVELEASGLLIRDSGILVCRWALKDEAIRFANEHSSRKGKFSKDSDEFRRTFSELSEDFLKVFEVQLSVRAESSNSSALPASALPETICDGNGSKKSSDFFDFNFPLVIVRGRVRRILSTLTTVSTETRDFSPADARKKPSSSNGDTDTGTCAEAPIASRSDTSSIVTPERKTTGTASDPLAGASESKANDDSSSEQLINHWVQQYETNPELSDSRFPAGVVVRDSIAKWIAKTKIISIKSLKGWIVMENPPNGSSKPSKKAKAKPVEDAEVVAKRKAEAERLEAERLEAARLEAERLEAERLEDARKEREEAERLEVARKEREEAERERDELLTVEARKLNNLQHSWDSESLSDAMYDGCGCSTEFNKSELLDRGVKLGVIITDEASGNPIGKWVWSRNPDETDREMPLPF